MSGVLVVEDNAIFRQLVMEMLQDFPFLDIDEASTGDEALRKFAAQRPDLVFVDLELGGEDGFSLIKQIRAIDPGATIAILTSFDLPGYKEIGDELKVDYFLTKGLSTQEDIHRVITNLLDHKAWKNKRVFSLEGEPLAVLEEALVHAQSKRIALGIVSLIFLDMPNMLFPIPWDAFSIDKQNRLTLKIEKDKLRHAPGFQRDERPDLGNGLLGRVFYIYYGYEPFWGKEEDHLASMTFAEEAFSTKQGSC